MCRRLVVGLLVGLLGHVAHGQEIVGDAPAALSEEVRLQLFASLIPALVDPYSAKLHNVQVGETAVCGFVNAKNQFGAYVGLAPFAFTPHDGAIIVIPSTDQTPAGDFKRSMLAIYGCAIDP